MRVLIFGGSFDPPHLGHAALLAAAAKTIRPDRILIVPAHQAPLKKSAPGAPARDRLSMIRLGLLPRLSRRWRKITRLDLGEIESRRRVYTVETLARLRRRHPEAEFHFVTGSDAAASFHLWRNPGKLRTLCAWWTAGRPGSSGRVPGFFRRVPGRMPAASSTEIRAALAIGEDASRRLAPAVLKRIKKRGLYGAALRERLRRSLSEERYGHSLAVARLAERLARRWGLDAEKAGLAGLLHDCGRTIRADRMAAYARSRGLRMPLREEIISRHPLLLHAYISEDLSRRRYGVSDPAVLSAVRKHTLGGRRMSDLDRLLYVADSLSEDREYPGVDRLRRIAFRDLGKAFRGCVRAKLDHARAGGAVKAGGRASRPPSGKASAAGGGWLHPLTLSLWNSLKG